MTRRTYASPAAFKQALEQRLRVGRAEDADLRIDQGTVSTDHAILESIAAGSLRDGVIAGVRSAADVLAEHFPWEEGDRNEVPDRVVVRRE